MKKILTILICFVLASCYEMSNDPKINYTTKITYCDNRMPDTINFEGTKNYYPNKHQIRTFRIAVPTWFDYINVCDVTILDQKIQKP